MHEGTLTKWALALTFWLAVHKIPLHAQLLGPYGTSPVTFEVDANGLLSDTGSIGTGTLSLSGAGTRMFWYPGKAAFRAGLVVNTEWNDVNIGQFSVAFGLETTASGQYSAAFGAIGTASGLGSAVFGEYNTASGESSAAFGSGSTASGSFSLAFGYGAISSGGDSVAFGNATKALSPYSAAFGSGTTASGVSAMTWGYSSSASGAFSTASGYNTTATAFESFVAGRYNVGGGNGASWVSIDPLFEIGNGTSSTVKSDAFVVYKNGSATFQGPITAAPGGDIPMYTGN